MMAPKPALGALSVVIGFVAYGVYIYQSAKKDGVQPHPFSWFLWFFVTTVAALAQWAKGAGPGWWVTAFTAGSCFFIAIFTYLRHRGRFPLFDWLSLVAGAVVFGFYLYLNVTTKYPTVSAILATAADLAGYLPTLRKGWVEPDKDSVTSFGLNSVKFVPALWALSARSIATWLYPASLIVANAVVAVMLLWRRGEILAVWLVTKSFVIRWAQR